MAAIFAELDRIDPAEAWQPWQPCADDPWGPKWAATSTVARLRAQPRRPRRGRASWPPGTLELLLRGRPEARGDRGDAGRRRPDRRRERRRRRTTPRLVAVLHAPERPPAAREDDAVLAQPLRHQPRQGAEPGPDVRPERAAAQPCPGQVRPVAAGDEPGRGHAGLARLQQQRQGQAQRELRPRADGALQPGRRQLHREGRPRGRPRLHRLADRRRRVFGSTPACTTAAPRPFWVRPAPGTAATSCASCSSSRRPRVPGPQALPLLDQRDGRARPTADRAAVRIFRRSDYDIAVLVRTMLGSRPFFSDHAFRQRIKGPVEYVLGAVRRCTRPLVKTKPLPAAAPAGPGALAGGDGPAALHPAERQGLAGRHGPG